MQLRPDDTFVMTNLHLLQVGTASASGHSVSNGEIGMEVMFGGNHHSGTTPNVAVDASTVVVQSHLRFDGSFYRHTWTANNAWANIAGNQLRFEATFAPPEISPVQVRFELDLELGPNAEAHIASVSNLEPTCQHFADGFRGAEVSVSGSVAPAAAVPSWRTHAVHADGSTVVSFLQATSGTIRVPAIASPLDRSHQLEFQANTPEGFWHSESRSIRVTDRTAPHILETELNLPCKWGSSAGEPNPQLPAMCGKVSGVFQDECSAIQTPDVLAIRVYSWPSGSLLRNEVFANGADACVHPMAGFLDAQLSMVDYEIDYRVRDAWGNHSQARRWRGYVYLGSSSSCTEQPTIVTLSDVSL